MPTLGELLLALRRKLAERSQKSSLHDKLSVSQFEALWFIALSGSVTMEAVSTHLGIKPPSATALIAALKRKGLVERARDPEDRRVVNVMLTPMAKRHLGAMKRRKDRAFESLVSRLSVRDQRELSRLLILLTDD